MSDVGDGGSAEFGSPDVGPRALMPPALMPPALMPPALMPPALMPPEWYPHARTFMAWPTTNATFGSAGALSRARHAWAQVASTIADFEPVTLLVDPDDVATAAPLAASGSAVELSIVRLDDAWLRDTGPTFVHRLDGSVAAVAWEFNGWGAQHWARWDNDAKIAAHVGGLAGVPVQRAGLVNEGGGLQVDGRGTVLLTDTVQRDPNRNPGMTRRQVEQLVHTAVGTSHAVWLPRGLTADYGPFGTRGHVDLVAAFTPSGAVLVHTQTDPAHPDRHVSNEIANVLSGERRADGRALELIELPAPRQLRHRGELVDWSYVNHYVGNGFVLLGAFDDPRDDQAAAILADVYPDRDVRLVDGRDIFAFGGGIHCITQQQPTAR